MKDYQLLIQFALAAGHSVSVQDADGMITEFCHNFDQIVADVEDCEDCYLHFYNSNKERLGWALITPFEADDETIADYSMTPFMEEWEQVIYPNNRD